MNHHRIIPRVGQALARIHSRRAGFSVVEILIVVALVGIALALILPNLQTSLAQGRLETHRNIAVELNSKISDFLSAGGTIGTGTNAPTAVQVTEFLSATPTSPSVARTVGAIPATRLADGPTSPTPLSQNVSIAFPRGLPVATNPAVDTQFLYDGVTYVMNSARTRVLSVAFGGQTVTLP